MPQAAARKRRKKPKQVAYAVVASIQFLGAARTVTGSKHALFVGKKTLLVDCGLFQGRSELKELNWKPLPIRGDQIDAVLLTHGHIDHIGYLPRLYKQGYRGPVYCTRATADIARLSLPDSGRLQEEYADYANRKGFSRHKPALPLYTEKEAVRACKLLEPIPYYENLTLPGKCTARFLIAGHILGAAFIQLYLPDGRTILFGGDLGRYNVPILKDPDEVSYADYLLVESTYGNRSHAKDPPRERFCDEIKRVIETGGVLVVPAFAIGRTQELLYYLSQTEQEHSHEPLIPVYLDSPMSAAATRIYSRYPHLYDEETSEMLRTSGDPLAPRSLHTVTDVSQSKALNFMDGPAVILSSSGMASGGRVVHHLAHRLPDERNTVLFVGYQAEGTLGRRLVEGASEVTIMGETVPVRARIASIQSLSAHADADGILRWLRGFKKPPKRTFLVHGEPEAQEALDERIRTELGWETEIPALHDVAQLDKLT